VGLFHFRPWDFLRHNPLFAATVIPNLLKEYADFLSRCPSLLWISL